MIGVFDKPREPGPMICRKKRLRKLRNEQRNLPYVEKYHVYFDSIRAVQDQRSNEGQFEGFQKHQLSSHPGAALPVEAAEETGIEEDDIDY